MKKNTCPICDQPTSQTLILLKGLKKRMILKNNKIDEEYQEIKENDKNSHTQIFTKVIEMITLGENQRNNGCFHRKIHRDFYRKMRCSQTSFKQTCQQILNQLAHKSFQLDVISQQVSILEERVLQIKRSSKLNSILLSKTKSDRKRLKLQKNESKNLKSESLIMHERQQIKEILVKNEQQVQPGLSIPNQAQGGIIYWPILFPQFGN